MIPSIRGWVYLEATLNDPLQFLLKRTPGVILRQSHIVNERITLNDYIPLLKPTNLHWQMPEVGKWVQVRRGIYKGDVGYVDSVDTWGVQLLLIPRLPPPPDCPISLHPKRKRLTTQTRAAPVLFDPLCIKQIYGTEPTRIQENTYSFRNFKFEHGLMVKSFIFNSISPTDHHMPLRLFTLFRESGHPKLIASERSFPRPSEWEFVEGEEVQVLPRVIDYASTVKNGIIKHILDDSVEVDLASEEGIVSVPWLDIRKVMNAGD
jgi:hypothetical protein